MTRLCHCSESLSCCNDLPVPAPFTVATDTEIIDACKYGHALPAASLCPRSNGPWAVPPTRLLATMLSSMMVSAKDPTCELYGLHCLMDMCAKMCLLVCSHLQTCQMQQKQAALQQTPPQQTRALQAGPRRSRPLQQQPAASAAGVVAAGRA